MFDVCHYWTGILHRNEYCIDYQIKVIFFLIIQIKIFVLILKYIPNICEMCFLIEICITSFVSNKSDIRDAVVHVFVLSTVHLAWSGQTKDYEIGTCFSINNAALRSNIRGWLAWYQDNVSEWDDMSTHGLLFQ